MNHARVGPRKGPNRGAKHSRGWVPAKLRNDEWALCGAPLEAAGDSVWPQRLLRIVPSTRAAVAGMANDLDADAVRVLVGFGALAGVGAVASREGLHRTGGRALAELAGQGTRRHGTGRRLRPMATRSARAMGPAAEVTNGSVQRGRRPWPIGCDFRFDAVAER